MTEQPTQYQAELKQRQGSTALIVRLLLALIVGLSLAAFLGHNHFQQRESVNLDIAVRIMILTFGLGSIALRRTKFSVMRLQDITALAGISGLLKALQKTTLQVAGLGIFIAIFGFVATVLTGNDFYAFGAGLVAVVVLLYCYPTLSSWQRAVTRFSTPSLDPPPSGTG
jgi:hypothetical protein